MDGFTVAQWMKQKREYAGVSVMMLTPANLTREAAKYREVGIEQYLVKPVSQGELKQAVRAVFAHTTGGSFVSSTADLLPFPRWTGKRILVAEDNPVNQRLATRLVQKHGHSIEIASNGVDAVRRSAIEDFDIILMDVQMPDMDGLQATAAIREREKTTGKHVHILAVTAHALAGDRERCLAAGMDGYISKPIRAEELMQAVEALGAATPV
jgi:CheY-like chemotaxis protein